MLDFIQTINPATGNILSRYPRESDEQIERKLQLAFAAFLENRQKTIEQKKNLLNQCIEVFKKYENDLAKLITLEMGKPISDSHAEVKKCLTAFVYYSDLVESQLRVRKVKSQYQNSYILHQPLGPLLAIMPWNYPIWQLVRVLAPAIAIGNPVILKHSDITAGVALLLEKMMNEIEVGLLVNLNIEHQKVEKVIADQRVRAVTLTGSRQAGSVVAQLAGKYLKKSVLELGGSDPYLILADADLDLAAKICAQAKMVNNGQACIAAKRFLVDAKVFDSFVDKFQKQISNFKVGDPLDKQVQVGSLAHLKFKSQLLSQCQHLKNSGAKNIFHDGSSVFNENAFFSPTILEIQNQSDPFLKTEELFGPVALVFKVIDEKEMINLANQTHYGLGSAVFTKDIEKAADFVLNLECGFVAVNEQVKSDANLPFGGVKESGYGRELSVEGMNEFSNVKSVGSSIDFPESSLTSKSES